MDYKDAMRISRDPGEYTLDQRMRAFKALHLVWENEKKKWAGELSREAYEARQGALRLWGYASVKDKAKEIA